MVVGPHFLAIVVCTEILKQTDVCVLPDLSVCTLHADMLSRNLLPSLCLLHHCLCIHQTKAIQVADCKKQ